MDEKTMMVWQMSKSFVYFFGPVSSSGPIMFSGRTHSSNCFSVNNPNLRHASFNDNPSLCAVFAAFAASKIFYGLEKIGYEKKKKQNKMLKVYYHIQCMG